MYDTSFIEKEDENVVSLVVSFEENGLHTSKEGWLFVR